MPSRGSRHDAQMTNFDASCASPREANVDRSEILTDSSASCMYCVVASHLQEVDDSDKHNDTELRLHTEPQGHTLSITIRYQADGAISQDSCGLYR